MLFFISSFVFVDKCYSQNPPPPPPPNGGPNNGHGLGGNQGDGPAAPIGSGTLLLISLGMIYGGKKIYNNCIDKEQLS